MYTSDRCSRPSHFTGFSYLPALALLLVIITFPPRPLVGQIADSSVASSDLALLTAEVRDELEGSPKVGDPLIGAIADLGRARAVVAFEVPGLIEAQERGLPDSESRSFQLIIEEIADDLLLGLELDDFEIEQRFSSLSAIALTVNARGLISLSRDQRVVRIDLDEAGGGDLQQTKPLTRLDSVIAQGYTGAGVRVAVLDSGIDTNHPDLSDDLVAQHCLCIGGSGQGCCPNGSSQQAGTGSAEDDHGHGTLVSGVITSRGQVAAQGGAPDAEIVAVKVLDSQNRFGALSQITAALNWIINNRPDVDIVNMSLGTDALYSGNCDNANAGNMAIAQAINTLRARNVPVFVSSGNTSSTTQMQSPACVAAALSVGAVYDANIGSFSCDKTTAADKVACFSNSSTTTDLFAPGALMTGPGLGGGTTTSSGTSFSSPTAAACAADLLDFRSTLTHSQIESAVETSSTTVARAGRLFPRLDCQDALASLTSGTCTPNTTTMCLNNGRFRVRVNWTTPQGSSGSGRIVSTSADSGVFWFFNSNNWEMMVKVLNGCTVNNRYWVFAAGTTNVAWTLTVFDTVSGQTKTYSNPQGVASCAVTDTTAFATCP